jgi:hypothetical protein
MSDKRSMRGQLTHLTTTQKGRKTALVSGRFRVPFQNHSKHRRAPVVALLITGWLMYLNFLDIYVRDR